MAVFKKSRTFKQVFYSRPVFILLVVLLLVAAHGTWKIYEKAIIAAEQKDRAAKDLADLKAREMDLEAKIASLKTDRGLEEEIRQRFSVVKNGESVVVVVDPSTQQGTSTQDTDSGVSFWWHKFLGIFGKK
jgi:cell division protein FtsB